MSTLDATARPTGPQLTPVATEYIASAMTTPLSTPVSRRGLRGVSPALLIASAMALPPAAAADADTAASSTLDTVLVTGSRTSTRTVKNSSTPIDVVSAEDLAATGKSNLLEALQYSLPSLSQVGGYQNSWVRGYQLRNLSPGYTLVLVNGKRRNTSAFVAKGEYPGHTWTDLALIPVAAIDHIEVLRDGASAIYGSDAIAGVINIILKSQAEGGSASIESGESFEGDGSRTTLRANIGLPWGANGFINLSAENTHQQHAQRPLTYLDTLNIGGAQRDANRIYSTPAFRLKSAVLNAGYGIGDNLDFYATATASDRTNYGIQVYRLPSTIASNNPEVLSVWPNGFSPTTKTTDAQHTGTAGLKGLLGGWDYDLSATYNRDTLRGYTLNSANYSLDYPGSPIRFYGGKLDYQQAIGNLDLRRSFEIAGLASPLEVSAGVEYQHEQYRRDAGQWESYYGYGAQASSSYSTNDIVDATRNSKAIYVGASANLSARWFLDAAARYEDHSDFGDVSTGRLSTRFDFNDVFGIRATVSNGFHAPSLAAQYYQVSSNCPCGNTLTARVGSAAARALGATDLKPEKARNYSVGLTFNPSRNFHAALDVYQIDLRDRVGLSSSIGYDATLAGAVSDSSGTTLSAAQKATIDRLLATADVAIQPGEAYYVTYFTNIGDTRTRGVELTLEATQDTGWGRLRWNYALNYGTTDITRVAPIPTVLQSLPNIGLLSESVEYTLRYSSPAYTQVAGLGWNQGRWGLNLNLQHFGPIKRLANGYRYQIDPRVVVHLGGSYEVGNGWSVDLGVDNLFNQTSRKIPAAALSNSDRRTYTYVYDTGDRISTVGGYWYGRINYRF